MKYRVEISDITTVTEVPDYWAEADLRALLEAMSVDEVADLPAAELRDYLALALDDMEPAEGAAVVLRYKITEDELSDGQLEQVSHDMLVDKVVEEYPDISLHERLWHCNQLLRRGYNGKFPNTEASVIRLTCTPSGKTSSSAAAPDEAAMLQILSAGLKPHAVLPRLLQPQLEGTEAFPTAEYILWDLRPTGDDAYEILTSDYWLSGEDFGEYEFEGERKDFVEAED